MADCLFCLPVAPGDLVQRAEPERVPVVAASVAELGAVASAAVVAAAQSALEAEQHSAVRTAVEAVQEQHTVALVAIAVPVVAVVLVALPVRLAQSPVAAPAWSAAESLPQVG